MSVRFAMVTDTHVGLVPLARASAERLGRVYAAIGRLAPDFVLHCGDITDTGLPGEYELYQQMVPAALRGRPGMARPRSRPARRGHAGPLVPALPARRRSRLRGRPGRAARADRRS